MWIEINMELNCEINIKLLYNTYNLLGGTVAIHTVLNSLYTIRGSPDIFVDILRKGGRRRFCLRKQMNRLDAYVHTYAARYTRCKNNTILSVTRFVSFLLAKTAKAHEISLHFWNTLFRHDAWKNEVREPTNHSGGFKDGRSCIFDNSRLWLADSFKSCYLRFPGRPTGSNASNRYIYFLYMYKHNFLFLFLNNYKLRKKQILNIK